MFTDISLAEKEYITHGCFSGIRCDGRNVTDFRPYFFESEIFPHVNGSARLKVGERTDILAAVKVEIAETDPSDSEKGLFDISIDISPSCNIKIDDRKLNDIGSSISVQLESFYQTSNALDLGALCIISGKFCWAIHVDILVLQYDGDLLDTCSIAAYAALSCTKIPKVDSVIGESGKPDDFEVSSDISKALTLNVDNIPLVLTAYEIGSRLVLDVNGDEASCATSAISIAVDRKGVCCGVLKRLSGSTVYADIQLAKQMCRPVAVSIFHHIDSHLSSSLGENDPSGSRFKGLSKQHPDIPVERIGLLA